MDVALLSRRSLGGGTSPAILATLDGMWIEPPGYFPATALLPQVKFAFTNYGVSIGLQALGASADRVALLNQFFATYRSDDSYDRDAITHVMRCCSLFPSGLLRKVVSS